MKVIIIGVLVLTLGVAAVSTYLIRTFQTPEAMEQLEREKAVPKKFVLVATRDLQIGARVKPEDMTWVVWVDEALRDDYVVREERGVEADEEDLTGPFVGSLVRHEIKASEPIIAGKLFKRDTSGFLAGVLEPGVRATTVKVDQFTSVGGFIMPGDRVDVLLTHNKGPNAFPEEQRKDPDNPVMAWMTETIMRNLQVLSVGQQMGPAAEDAAAQVAPSITLAVTPKQAEILTVAMSMGKLSFVLRGLSDATAGDEDAERTYSTDVEASGFLTENQAAEEPEEDFEDDDTPVVVSQRPAIRVYRGQAQATEEVGEE